MEGSDDLKILWTVIDGDVEDHNGMPYPVTQRRFFPGGWLVRTLLYAPNSTIMSVSGPHFIPDPEHLWGMTSFQRALRSQKK